MSYQAEKLAVEKKLRFIKRIVFVVVAVLIATLCVLGAVYESSEWKYRVALPKITARAKTELRIHFVAVGDGDATIVELPDGKIALIDGGNGSGNANKSVLRHLNALGVETIDYFFLTRVDSGCFGGFSEIVAYKKIKTAYMPNLATETTNASYLSTLQKCKNAGVRVETMDRSLHFNENGYVLSVLSPSDIVTDKTYHAVIWLGYAGVGTLLASCKTKEAETSLIAEDRANAFSARGVALQNTQILKVASGGDKTATDGGFLEYLGVRTAIISCGKGNALRPAKDTLTALQDLGVKSYRTDKNGSIIATIRADGAYTVATLGV